MYLTRNERRNAPPELLQKERKVNAMAAEHQTLHRCFWPGCTRMVPVPKHGCRQHWFHLPKVMRAEIWENYQHG